MRIIDVRPLGQGWTVRGEQIDNDLVFRSGRAAEQAARHLAHRLAKVGIPSEVRIHLRDGTLGGRFFTPAAPPAEHRGTSVVREPAEPRQKLPVFVSVRARWEQSSPLFECRGGSESPCLGGGEIQPALRAVGSWPSYASQKVERQVVVH